MSQMSAQEFSDLLRLLDRLSASEDSHVGRLPAQAAPTEVVGDRELVACCGPVGRVRAQVAAGTSGAHVRSGLS